MKFSTALVNKFVKLAQEADLFSKLLRLHELWYKIKELEEKFSGAAEKAKEEHKADFYSESPAIIGEIINFFSEWVHFHSKDGWWDLTKRSFAWSKHKHVEFTIKDKKCVIDLSFCDQDLNDCKDYAWDKWKSFFPEYEKVMKQIETQISKLKSVINSNDIDNVMSTISLALNTAHNSGLMYEQLGMTEEELSILSNLDTSAWDAEIRRYAKKFWWSSIIKKS